MANSRPRRRQASASRGKPSDNSTGIAIDKGGDAAFDPSQNVKELNERAEWRQDDLRELNNEVINAKLETVRVEQNCLEKASLREQSHAKEIRDLETSRINAVRQVDVLAGQTTAAEARQATQTLAATTNATAEGLRNTVATTAATLATSNGVQFAEILKRIGVVEQSIAVGAGRQLVADPIQTQLLEEVKALRTSQATVAGRQTVTDPAIEALTKEVKSLAESRDQKKGGDMVWAYVVVLATLGLGVFGIAITLIAKLT